jgi:Mrp family chromosome partitioning ATPase
MPAGITIARSRPFTTAEAARQTFLRWYILIPVTLGGSAAAFFLKDRVEPAYSSTAAIKLIPPTVRPQVETGVQLPSESPPDSRTLADTLQEFVLETESVRAFLKTRPDLFPGVDKLGDRFIKWMRLKTRIVPKGANLYGIEAWGHDADQAKALTRWIATATMEAYRKALRAKGELLANYTKEQLAVAKKALDSHEEQMIAFLRANPGLLVTAMDRDKRLSATGPDRMRVKAMLQRVGSALTAKDPALRALLEERERIQASLKGLKGSDAPSSPAAAKLRELEAAKKRLEDLKAGGRGDADPAVKIAQRQVKEIEAELKTLRPGEESAATQAEAKARARLKEIEKKLKVALKQPQSSPRLEQQWGEMLRKQTLQVKIFEGYNRLASLAAYDHGLGLFETKDLASLAAEASEPTAPKGIKPWMLLAVGVFVSGLLGLGLAIAFGRLDRKIYNTEELTQLVSLPLLAELRQQSNRDALRASDEERVQSDGMIGWSKKEEVLSVGIKLSGSQPGASSAGVISDGGRLGQMTLLGDGGRGGRLLLPSHEQSLQPVGTSMVLDLLAEVPTTNMCVRSVVASPPLSPGLFLVTAPRSPGADQVRLLAGRLSEGQAAAQQRVVLVAGWEPRAGRTTVAANLALALAEARRRVLLVDACGGDRSLTRLLGLRVEEGTALYEQLAARTAGTQSGGWTFYKLAESLSVVPASSSTSPMGPMLSAVAFGDFMEQCRGIFDVVVLDSRPLSEVSDAVILTQKSDAVITVVRRRATKLPGLQQLADQLGARRMIGTVFNHH